MKKITFFSLFLVLALLSVAQSVTQRPFLKPVTDFKPFSPSTKTVRAVNDSIWSDDFSVPANWTMSHTGGTGDWEIQTAFNSAAGCGTGTVSSTTFQNGFAVYDACQFGDTIGEDVYIQYNGTIDCSAYSNITIHFQQRLRKGLDTHTFFEVSTNGTVWQSFEVNTNPAQLVTNDIVLNISDSVANQPTVYLRFHYYGKNMYLWSIDDVALVEGGDYDLFAENFMPQFIQGGTLMGWFCELPYNNVLPLGYRTAAVRNVGANLLTGLTLTTDITETGTSVFNHVVFYGDTLFPAWRDTLIDTVAFHPAATPNYTYTVKMITGMNETDQDISNNMMLPPKTFSVTDGVIRRSCAHNCWISPSNFGSSNGTFLSDVFILPNIDTVFWEDFTVLADSTALADGASLQGIIYMYDSTTANWITIIQSDLYDITPSDTVTGGHQVNLPYMLDGFTEILQSNYLYAAGVSFNYSNGWVGIAGDNSVPQNYPATNLIIVGGIPYYTSCTPDIGVHFDSLPQFDTLPQVIADTCIYFNYTQVYVESYSWIDPTHVEVVWAFAGSGQIAHIIVVYEVLTPGNYVLSIVVQCGTKSMHIYYDNVYIDQYVGMNSPGEFIEKSLLIYPNPVNDLLNIRFRPETKNSTVEIFNSLGQCIYRKRITFGFLNVDVNKLNQGIYFVRVQTGNTILSGKFNR
ncbi:MAG: T9SS type A sorting domain-containing protein [Bacteroidales bacterium]|nr:T9SS type A sorting domain-containing protein [Bacteroidales bacterium]